MNVHQTATHSDASKLNITRLFDDNVSTLLPELFGHGQQKGKSQFLKMYEFVLTA